MSSFRICPTEKPGVTRMEFDYYHTESGDIFEEYFRFVRQVAIEDFELCEKAQENLEKGVYTEGILNPVKETGVVCKQFPIKNVFFKILMCYIKSISNAFSTLFARSTRGRRNVSIPVTWFQAINTWHAPALWNLQLHRISENHEYLLAHMHEHWFASGRLAMNHLTS
jgi:hypothetical protein